MSSVFLWVAMPALLTGRSRRPKVSTVFWNSAMIASSLVRSAGSGSASPPLALMPAATSSSSAARRATSTVFAPSAANSSAMPRPMPLLAPVTIAILPWSCPAILYSRSRKCHYSRKVRHGHNRLFGCATGRRAWSRVSSFWDYVPLPAKADIAGRRLHVRFVPKADIALCHSITSSARNRSEVGIVGLIYERLRWGCARGDLVLRFGREIAGVMSFVQLFFKRPGGAVDHPPALDSRALADFFCPARQIFIFVRLQELARVVVGGAIQHPVAVPQPDRHIGNRIFVARDEMIVRKLPVEHVELAFQLHCKTVDGVFDLHRSIGIEMPEAAAHIGR